MPKVVRRFSAFFTILLLWQLVSAVPDSLDRPAYGVGTLVGFSLWAALGIAAVRGFEGARKAIVFLTCLGLGACAIATFSGVVVLAQTKEPLVVFVLAFALIKAFVCVGVLMSAAHEDFRAWVVHKGVERANAKYALA